MTEPGGLLSMGSHRVGHDWSDLAAAAAAYTSEHTEIIKLMNPKSGQLTYIALPIPSQENHNKGFPTILTLFLSAYD